MTQHQTSYHRATLHRGWRLVALLTLCCWSISGCNWTLPRGEGFNDELSTWGQTVRNQETSDGTPLGTSSKALEIERNLGYR